MVDIWVETFEKEWYGLAADGEAIVATAVADVRERVLGDLRRDVRSGEPSRVLDEPTAFIRATMRMLVDLEHGREERKQFTLSERCIPAGVRAVLTVAASIPIGYATSYGRIAKTAGSQARPVGRLMATNPLYPIVPCHRVVGANLALVGYGGRQDRDALAAKLSRLRHEARGYREGASTPTALGSLEVIPVEWVIRRAARELAEGNQLSLF